MTATPRPTTLEAAWELLAVQQAQLAQLRADQEVWLRAVAHDLRAPLRHVLSFAPLLLESVEELAAHAPQATDAVADAREFADAMAHSARKLAAMLDGLTQLSRAARSPLHPEWVDWVALAQQLAQPLQATHPQLQWSWPTQAVQIWADAEGVRQLTQALLDNAVKFTAHQPQPHIIWTADNCGAAGWTLGLTDNGVGFDRARAHHLFQPFQRMHRDSEFPGVGCGLALVQAWVQRHGGRAVIEAEVGQGCSVVLHWPGAPSVPA